MQKGLFPSDDDALGYVSEERVRSLLKDANPFLWHAVYSPWEDFQGDRQRDARFRDLSIGESAWWLHTQIKRMAIMLAEDSPEYRLVRSSERSNQFYLNLSGELVLVFKKLRRVYSRRLGRDVLVRSNYPTDGNCDFWEQRRRNGAPDAPRVIVGYEPVKEMTEIRLHIGYPRTKGWRFDWIYEMPDQIDASRAFRAKQKAREEREQEMRRNYSVEPIEPNKIEKDDTA